MSKNFAVVVLVLAILLTSVSAVFASSEVPSIPVSTAVPDMMNVYTLVEKPRDGSEDIIVEVFYFDEVETYFFISRSEISASTEDGFVRGLSVLYEQDSYFMASCSYSSEVCTLVKGLQESEGVALDFDPQSIKMRSIPTPSIKNDFPADVFLYPFVEL